MANVDEWTRTLLERAFGPSERCGGADWSVEAAYYVTRTSTHALFVILDDGEVSLTLRPTTEENVDNEREWATEIALRPLEVIEYLEQQMPSFKGEMRQKWIARCEQDIATRGGEYA